MTERLRELIAKWRETAAADRRENQELNARLQRGETVTIKTVPFNAQYTDHREQCADELEALLRSKAGKEGT